MIIYDIEIKNGIQSKREKRIEGITYCEGWHDHGGMGISVIGAYDYSDGSTRVFCDDNLDQFVELTKNVNCIIGYNSRKFDNRVVQAVTGHIIPDADSYDLLVEIWKGAGLSSEFNAATHGGYSLDEMALANLNVQKSGNGALAPVHWQRGKIGTVIDYCLRDVWLTKRLIDLVMSTGALFDPKQNKFIKVNRPTDLHTAVFNG